MVALTHLARAPHGTVASIGTLAEALRMPRPFLEKTLLALKHAGYLQSKMGKHGGFLLALPPSEIRLADVVRLFGQPIAPTRSVSKFFFQSTPLARDSGLTRFFKSIRDYSAMCMETTTVADVVGAASTAAGTYLDNATTSFPKPEEVLQRMDWFARHEGGSAGPSGHGKTVAAQGMIAEVRERVARLFSAPSSDCVCLMSNATEALNTAIYGLAEPGCRIVTTSMEHNSVWRPLADLRRRMGCEVIVVRADRAGICDAKALTEAVTPNTAFVVMTCASNVTGAVQPVGAVAERCRKHGVPLVLDGAQAAGALPVDLGRLPNSALAFTGHKGLMGPQGTGGLVVDPALGARMRPLKRGSTGTPSDSSDQPETLPEKFESGTANGHGIAGLGAGIEYVTRWGVETIRAHEMRLWSLFREGLSELPHVRVLGPDKEEESVAILSLTVDGMAPVDVGTVLDVREGVTTQAGLHCAPLAHETIGTMPLGTVRFSFGPGNTETDVEAALAAVAGVRKSP